MLKWVLLVIAIVLGGLWYTFAYVCPCVTLPGGALQGDMQSTAVTDWAAGDANVNNVGLCQVQVEQDFTWSINLNCMSDNKKLYVSCSQCADKKWSNAALANSAGFIRVGTRVYPITYRRVIDAAELDAAWTARATKLSPGETKPRPDHWWSFELASR